MLLGGLKTSQSALKSKANAIIQMLFSFFLNLKIFFNLARNSKFCETYMCTHILALVCTHAYGHGLSL